MLKRERRERAFRTSCRYCGCDLVVVDVRAPAPAQRICDGCESGIAASLSRIVEDRYDAE